MMSAKFFIALALFAVCINGMSKEFELGQNEIDIVQEVANSSEFISKQDLKGVFTDIIEKTMANYKWTSDNFSSMFTEEILRDLLGKEIEVSSVDLCKFLNDNKISSIYKSYFKKIVSFLAKELDQEQQDLEDNFENYSLSFDTYFILSYQIPKQN